MATEVAFIRLVAVTFLLVEVAYVMKHEDQNSDGFTFRGIERNDSTMLYNNHATQE